jgi:hypothetical protein
MTSESNKYALNSLNEVERGKIKLITVNEMKKFISLIIYMGICKLPTYEMHWKLEDNVFSQDFPIRTISYDRFCEIKKYFHVFDNETFLNDLQTNTGATKLDGLIEYFDKKLRTEYTPQMELAIDENLCSCSDKEGSKVYMPLKLVKYWPKLYALCEAKTGYAYVITLYNKNRNESNLEIINRLTEHFLHRNYHFYMDNFYSGINLFECLKKRSFLLWNCKRKWGGPKKLKSAINNLSRAKAY